MRSAGAWTGAQQRACAKDASISVSFSCSWRVGALASLGTYLDVLVVGTVRALEREVKEHGRRLVVLVDPHGRFCRVQRGRVLPARIVKRDILSSAHVQQRPAEVELDCCLAVVSEVAVVLPVVLFLRASGGGVSMLVRLLLRLGLAAASLTTYRAALPNARGEEHSDGRVRAKSREFHSSCD